MSGMGIEGLGGYGASRVSAHNQGLWEPKDRYGGPEMGVKVYG